jgi:TATA-binding protein-associated factor
MNSLQKFKLNIASSVINQDNKGLPSMDTDGVLDLFNLSSGDDASSIKANDKKKAGKLTTKQVLEQMEKEGLWGDEYNELGDMDEFLKGLSK